MSLPLRLGVNIDHVATIRNARGGTHPDPVAAALLAEKAGADGITAHLREDRRHICDEDIARLKTTLKIPLNFEMAATEEMVALALEIRPHACCLVPEKRQEVTTEGGLDVVGQLSALKPVVQRLIKAGIRVSLFIDADERQVKAARETGAAVVEFHTGKYAEHFSTLLDGGRNREAGGVKVFDTPPDWLRECALPQGGGGSELQVLQKMATLAHSLGLECHAGHGLNYDNVGPIAAIPEIVELNIGHFLIGQAVFEGLGRTIAVMRERMRRQ